MSVDKTVFVLWSGGADSTAVIEHCLADEQYFAVLAGYVRIGNNAAKAEAELHAIEGMLPHLQRTDKFVYQGVIMDLALTRSNPNLAYKQVPIWLLALVAALHTPVSEVALGYIKNTSGEEDATTHLPDIERIYYAHQPLMHRPMPRLVFPLLHRSKAEVL